MADVLKTDTVFWPVDKVILAYFAFAIALCVIAWNRLAEAPALLAAHVAGGAALIYEVKRPNPSSWIFRNWYPLLYVASCYKEMALLIPALRSTDADQALASLDHRLWGADPTVWLERIHSRPLTEFLQIAYTLFIPAVLYICWALWRKQRYGQFQYYGFLVALGFLVSYVGYLLVPARGPRFLLANLQHIPLNGLWFFNGMQAALNRLEAAHFDCFPSGHTELTIIAMWGSRMVSKPLFFVYLAYTPCIIFATVYLRYHYTLDLLAGAATAGFIIVAAPGLFRKLSQGA